MFTGKLLREFSFGNNLNLKKLGIDDKVASITCDLSLVGYFENISDELLRQNVIFLPWIKCHRQREFDDDDDDDDDACL